MVLRTRYRMSSTDLGNAATSEARPKFIPPGKLRYPPTLSAYAISAIFLRDLPTISLYAIFLRYLPTRVVCRAQFYWY
eukprot:905864-Rhodomonas_salina.2